MEKYIVNVTQSQSIWKKKVTASGKPVMKDIYFIKPGSGLRNEDVSVVMKCLAEVAVSPEMLVCGEASSKGMAANKGSRNHTRSFDTHGHSDEVRMLIFGECVTH